MICPTCHGCGNAVYIDPINWDKGVSVCRECQGSGIAYCCDKAGENLAGTNYGNVPREDKIPVSGGRCVGGVHDDGAKE